MKSLALENYGVDTLSFDEMMVIDGGSFWGMVMVIAGVVAAVAGLISVFTC